MENGGRISPTVESNADSHKAVSSLFLIRCCAVTPSYVSISVDLLQIVLALRSLMVLEVHMHDSSKPESPDNHYHERVVLSSYRTRSGPSREGRNVGPITDDKLRMLYRYRIRLRPRYEPLYAR